MNNSTNKNQEFPDLKPESKTTFAEDMHLLGDEWKLLPFSQKCAIIVVIGIIVMGLLNAL